MAQDAISGADFFSNQAGGSGRVEPCQGAVNGIGKSGLAGQAGDGIIHRLAIVVEEGDGQQDKRVGADIEASARGGLVVRRFGQRHAGIAGFIEAIQMGIDYAIDIDELIETQPDIGRLTASSPPCCGHIGNVLRDDRRIGHIGTVKAYRNINFSQRTATNSNTGQSRCQV